MSGSIRPLPRIANTVFLQGHKLRNVDHASFTALNNCYARDCKSVWTTGGRFEPEDISSFVVCDDGVKLIEQIRTMSDGTQRPIRVRIPYGYAKDSKAVYYENFAGKIKILKRADPATFVSNNDGYFAWDAKSIFWGGYLLPKADLQSWRIVNTEMDLSRDDKHFYILNKPGHRRRMEPETARIRKDKPYGSTR